jgi:anti-sigma B factor antagonist
MALSVEGRHCGEVYIVRCKGNIVAGKEAQTLEASINLGLREFQRIALHVAGVGRVDSTGIGLMVRILSHTRHRGGDIRLAELPPFLTHLLKITRLNTVFRVYDSEEAAIVSFLREPSAAGADRVGDGPKVLFLDESPDLCAFVRMLLHNHGYDVSSTCRMHDAKILLNVGTFDYIVLGPDCSQLPTEKVAVTLNSMAPTAKTVRLQRAFKSDDPDRAGPELLRLLEGADNSQGASAS